MRGSVPVGDLLAALKEDQEFGMAWVLLSVQGECDGVGSAEFRRVFQEWVDAGQPAKTLRFIMERANLPF